jgi:citrate lyase subunit beta/citryl-CoA lyase
MTDHVPTTWLYIPAARAVELLPKAQRAADAVVIDLEDATHPSQRPSARRQIALALADPAPVPVVVRINPVDGPDFAADIDCVRPLLAAGRLNGLRLTKVAGPDQVATAWSALADVSGRPLLNCQLESADAVRQAHHIARCEGVATIMLGEADLRADLGLSRGEQADQGLLLARLTVVLACRAAGLGNPIGAAYTDLTNVDGLRQSSVELRRLGFYGRSVLHPRQVEVVRQVFAPTAEELSWANQVIERAAQMEDDGIASAALADGTFIDPAIVRQARLLLDRAGS